MTSPSPAAAWGVSLLGRGVPLAWAIDVPGSHPLFGPTQMLLATGAISSSSPPSDSLELRLDDRLSGQEATVLIEAGRSIPGFGTSSALPERWTAHPGEPVTRSQVLHALHRLNPGEGTLGELLTLGELCAALGPALQAAYASNQEDP